MMKKYLLSIGLIALTSRADINQIQWQDVYVVNNTDYDLELTADVTNIQNINNVEHVKYPIEKTSWLLPKRISGSHEQSMIRLDSLDVLHNIAGRVVVPDITKIPEWMQKPFSITIKKREPKILIIYIGQASGRWVIDQRYVTGVAIKPSGVSGYTAQVDQL
jgi:hypothetical protein